MQLITKPKTKSVCKRIFSDRRAPCTIHRHLLQIFFVSFECIRTCARRACVFVIKVYPVVSVPAYREKCVQLLARTHIDIVFVGSAYGRIHMPLCTHEWYRAKQARKTQYVCLMPYVRCSRVHRTLSSFSLRVPFRTQIMMNVHTDGENSTAKAIRR